MGRPQGGFAKRQKELARKEKRTLKLARKHEKAREDEAGAGVAPDEDPDLAGIQLGPQPPQDAVPDEGPASDEER
jgi:hypothetical protein